MWCVLVCFFVYVELIMVGSLVVVGLYVVDWVLVDVCVVEYGFYC